MHAKDRTLLASLGFADPDKKDRKHYLACKFLTQPEQRASVSMLFDTPKAAEPKVLKLNTGYCEARKQLPCERPWPNELGTFANTSGEWNRLRWTEVWTPTSGSTLSLKTCGQELALSKGTGQYKSTIGFIDAWSAHEWTRTWSIATTWKQKDVEYTATEPSVVETLRRSFAIEVKIAECDVDSIIRQLALYREHVVGHEVLERAHWVVATAFPISASDAAVLLAHEIRHIKLGARFKAFVEASADEAQSESVEF